METSTTQREYFTFFASYFRSINKLPKEMQLPLYKAICEYSLFFTEPDFSQEKDSTIIQAIWEGLLPNLQNNIKKFLAGKKGGVRDGTTNNPLGKNSRG